MERSDQGAGHGATIVPAPGRRAVGRGLSSCLGTGRRRGVDLAALTPQVAALVDTCWRLGALPEFEHVR
jgi:hypothetical protein